MRKSPEIDVWFASYENPQKEAMRDITLSADLRMEECIKWKTPTFTYKGNLASFNPKAKAHVSLMFHTGAQIPGVHPTLLGGGNTARYVQFVTSTDVQENGRALEAVVRAWCDSRD